MSEFMTLETPVEENKLLALIKDTTMKVTAFTAELTTTLEAITELGQAVSTMYETIVNWWDSLTMHTLVVTSKKLDPAALLNEINTAIENCHLYDVDLPVVGKVSTLAWSVRATAASFVTEAPLPQGYLTKDTNSPVVYVYHVRWADPFFANINDVDFWLSPEELGRGMVVAGLGVSGWLAGIVFIENSLDMPQNIDEWKDLAVNKSDLVNRIPGAFVTGFGATTNTKLITGLGLAAVAGLVLYFVMKK